MPGTYMWYAGPANRIAARQVSGVWDGLVRQNTICRFADASTLHDDVFIVPRVLVGVAGLVLLLAMLQLACALFADRKVSLITTLLGDSDPRSPDPQRHADVRHLLLSVAGRGQHLHPCAGFEQAGGGI